ncbi:hypothetical protein ACF08N_13065 [Streptomyces sp. NPDC015127]|uniref:hypothetical protein n=1 Tax=Streptomyces sp. NPDC015127 TaxID=3364939 RepID=UPI0037032A23
MLFGRVRRDRRHRTAVTASLLLGLLGTLLGCVTALSAGAAAATPLSAGAGGAGVHRAEAVPMVTDRAAVAVGAGFARGGAPDAGPGSDTGEAAAAGPVERPGCGDRTGAGDSGAHPGVPPRGGSAFELLPALPQAHGSGGVALVCDQTVLDLSPLRGPPPYAPPSAVDLSVLRV